MKKLLLASVAVLALGAAPVLAQDADANAAAGATAGGTTGAIAGGLLFGPIGAIIGGFTGASIGAKAGVDQAEVDYARTHPTDPVVLDGDVDAGYEVPETIVVHPVEGNDRYGYFYTNDRLYFVDLRTHEIVYSPGTVVAEKSSGKGTTTTTTTTTTVVKKN